MYFYDYERFFEEHDIDYSGPNSRGYLELLCPFCNKKKGGINTANNKYTCFKCGQHPLYELIYNLTGLNWNAISRQYKLNPDQADKIYWKMNRKKEHAKTIQPPAGSGPLSEEHKIYLRKRGFDPDYLIKKYKITATGPVGIIKNKNLFAYRIIIPIYYMHSIVSYQGRDWTDKAPRKYMTYSEDMEIVHHKDILYGLDHVPDEHIIVVEGIFDKWKLGDHAAATFGTGYTDAQVNILAGYKKVSIFFDPEEEAQMEAEQLCKRLRGLSVNSEIIHYPDGDPGSLSVQEAQDIVKEIINY
jgi:DNA primase